MSETFKYFAWKEKGYWRGQELLTRPQINALLTNLDWKKECFASIQSYDEFGNCLGSPLYFDFDGEPERVLFDVRHFVQACEFVVNITPRIYFSGNKGFHLIIDHQVEHPLCHLLVKDFAEEIAAVKTLDMQVYRSQSLLRIPTSPASIPGFYKIQVSRKELFKLDFEGMKKLATKRRMMEDDHSTEKIDTHVMEDWMRTALVKLPVYDNIHAVIAHTESVGMEMTPCIQSLLTKPQMNGNRHESLFILCRFFKLCGLDIASARRAIEAQDHWSVYEQQEGEVSKVLKSVFYQKKPPHLGCKGASSSAALMRSHCHSNCPYSPDFPKLTVIDLKGVAHLV